MTTHIIIQSIAFISLVKYGFVSPPSAGKQTFVPRLLEKRYRVYEDTPQGLAVRR
ncbi:hypothetical protein [Phormidium tenue]|jgi:hypothetical protein|uniref:Uncharacterized protein n=1 Tax=Phormidium tenue FACHB-1050 TaxID=2692857 RepID=A0ABR8C4V1_9CYAN|nr:hypothetical protein [Phormidium tenue FACHB-1050]